MDPQFQISVTEDRGPDVGDFFCIKEAAAHSGLPVAGLYRLARSGRLPHFWEGVQLRILRRGLDAYLALLDPIGMKYREEWQGHF